MMRQIAAEALSMAAWYGAESSNTALRVLSI